MARGVRPGRPSVPLLPPGRATVLALAGALLLGACASLRNALEPPRITQAQGRQPELRLIGPSAGRPIGGAAIRLWARVQNPNPFGLDLSTVAGTLFLEGTRAAGVELPLGLPLRASADTVIPMDLTVNFSDLPGLADVARKALTANALGYRLDGTIGVSAGVLGTYSFGPSTLLQGDVQVYR